MKGFQFRGLEFHNNRMWKWESVEKALNMMQQFDMNALIFHQNDLIDYLVEPQAYLSEEELWTYWPVRYCNIGTNIKYINKVIREAKKRGIDFYLEVKEIWYPEAILDKLPKLRGADGHICATDPFWFEFLRVKTEEVLNIVPDIAGIIVSPATRESKVSISANQCTCERCKKTTEYDWYYKYLQALNGPLSKKSKTLVVRDFAYSTSSQGAVIEAAENVSRDIVVALKDVPHDFWPVFPNNPAIERPSNLRKWIEYDVWGQYIGLGVYPCNLVPDIIKRHLHCLKNGCEGIWYRTDWEILNECSNFNSLNMVNLIGAAMHAKDPSVTEEDIYKAWTRYGITTAMREESCMEKPIVPTAPDAWKRLMDFMTAGYKVLEKTLYVYGHVFNYSCRYQHAYQSIYNVMNVYHKRVQWDKESAKYIVPTEENITRIIAEKEQALEESKQLYSILKPETLGIGNRLTEELKDICELYTPYVEGFLLSARAYFRMQKAYADNSAEDALLAKNECDRIFEFVTNFKKRLAAKEYPFYLLWMTDVDELNLLAKDISKRAKELTDRA